jgi:hypothetical protein
MIKPQFTAVEADAAHEEWMFNCGPGALCAVLGMKPAEIRPHTLDFEWRGYTNPTLMAGILDGLRIPFKRIWQWPGEAKPEKVVYPYFGLVRIQWAGPWTKPGVPMRARYRQTHWIAVNGSAKHGNGPWLPRLVFDINAMSAGGWIEFGVWKNTLVPWLLEGVPKATGDWWPTHCWELGRTLGRKGIQGVVGPICSRCGKGFPYREDEINHLSGPLCEVKR